MIYQPTRFLLCVALWVAPFVTAIATEQDVVAKRGIGAGLYTSVDSEDFSTQRTGFELLPDFKHGDARLGLRYTAHRFKHEAWSRRGEQISLLYRRIDPATADGWQIEAGFFRQSQSEIVTLDASYRAPLSATTSVEVFANRDWVETVNALNQGIHFNLVGAALEQRVGAHVTAIGLVARQNFSDENYRMHRRLKFIVQPDLDFGLTLQARYRAFDSARDDVGRNYFNPSRYEEAILVAAWRQRLQGWVLNASVGAGRQRIDDGARTPTNFFEIALQSPVSRESAFKIRSGFNSNAGFNGPDYRYRYVQIEWIIGF